MFQVARNILLLPNLLRTLTLAASITESISPFSSEILTIVNELTKSSLEAHSIVLKPFLFLTHERTCGGTWLLSKVIQKQ